MAWVTLADTIVRVLTAAREEPFRSRIAEGIRRYETHKTEMMADIQVKTSRELVSL